MKKGIILEKTGVTGTVLGAFVFFVAMYGVVDHIEQQAKQDKLAQHKRGRDYHNFEQAMKKHAPEAYQERQLHLANTN